MSSPSSPPLGLLDSSESLGSRAPRSNDLVSESASQEGFSQVPVPKPVPKPILWGLSSLLEGPRGRQDRHTWLEGDEH